MLARRSCQLCRKYMWDEETGEPITLFGKDKPAKRRGEVPCEGVFGCAKGHWRNRPDLMPGEALLIELYRAGKAGAFLTDDERNDPLILEVFAALVEVDEMLVKRQHQEELASLIAIATKDRNV